MPDQRQVALSDTGILRITVNRQDTPITLLTAHPREWPDSPGG